MISGSAETKACPRELQNLKNRVMAQSNYFTASGRLLPYNFPVVQESHLLCGILIISITSPSPGRIRWSGKIIATPIDFLPRATDLYGCPG
ncbi:unnamed protein product [Staurois parvus]|uniref:Uncharacterized protein n=1 Tax=Staurois parvus TaxID=386267 RepID=A0ABN9E6V3_9NEOB|nr:unnamed protein product [Staurois parvus]